MRFELDFLKRWLLFLKIMPGPKDFFVDFPFISSSRIFWFLQNRQNLISFTIFYEIFINLGFLKKVDLDFKLFEMRTLLKCIWTGLTLVHTQIVRMQAILMKSTQNFDCHIHCNMYTTTYYDYIVHTQLTQSVLQVVW